MDELTKTLWNYAMACKLSGCYDQSMKTEREENEKAAGRSRRDLESACQPNLQERIEDLCYYLEIIRSVDVEAAFTCGLQMGLSLR